MMAGKYNIALQVKFADQAFQFLHLLDQVAQFMDGADASSVAHVGDAASVGVYRSNSTPRTPSLALRVGKLA